MYQGFSDDIKKFNDIYKLPSHDSLKLPDASRITNFMDILREEVEEGQEIVEMFEASASKGRDQEILTALSDWLGDIIVYAASEARRAGIPLPEVLKIIMDSNFSKLDENGNPIYDERGKVMKGPSYWKPEPKISEIVQKYEKDS